MVVLYYLNASSTLVDPGADLEPWVAVAISVGLLAAAWLVYDVLCCAARTARVSGRVLVGRACRVGSELFSPRAAWLQVGAMLGTAMAGNVFFVIIPAHWELIRAKEAGASPTRRPGIKAKQRSVHNNYLTLPVLVTMLAGHFPFLTARLRVARAGRADGGRCVARLFFNLRHRDGRLVDTRWPARSPFVALAVARRAPTTTTGADAAAPIAAAAGTCSPAPAAAGATRWRSGATGTVGPNLDAARPSRRSSWSASPTAGGMPSFAGSSTSADRGRRRVRLGRGRR